MILFCGEALIDMIPEPTAAGPDGFVPHAGGAARNSAIALGRLGVPCGLLTGMSRDMFGQQLLQDLAASHVDTSHVSLSDRPTTLAFVKLTNGQASYSFFDENSAGRMLKFDDLPDIAPTVTALVFGGISLACEPGAQAYQQLAQSAAPSHVIMLDPNIRPGFIEDEDRYRARLDRMIAVADVVKVSDEDLDWIIPGNASPEDKMAGFLAAGPSVVIMTRGGDGALALLADGSRADVAGKSVAVVDTVGAGDTFNAAVLAWLWEGGLLTKPALKAMTQDAMSGALDFAAKVAAVTVSRAGANPPWRVELDG